MLPANTYGSKHYGPHCFPGSSKSFSRPFVREEWTLDETESTRLAKFKYGLLEIGKEYLGGESGFCCDIDRFPASHFQPKSEHEGWIADFYAHDGYDHYLATLPIEVQDALEMIVGQITNAKEYRDGLDVCGEAYKCPYDLLAMREPFKVLWQNDVFIDARVNFAEELFFYVEDDTRLLRDICPEKPLLIATLEWMGVPENASRIAQMFVYSRIAQHYGEQNPHSIAITQQIIKGIKSGQKKEIVEKLISEPEDFLRTKPPSTVQYDLLSIVMGSTKWADRLEQRAREKLKRQIMATEDLRWTAGFMACGYKRLANGSWANEQIAKLRVESELDKRDQKPQPSLAMVG